MLGQALLAQNKRADARIVLQRALAIQSGRPNAKDAARQTRALLASTRSKAKNR
jgi:hypothetical protein